MSSLDRTRIDPSHEEHSSRSEVRSELKRIGEMRILRRLGKGGMGEVYLSYHPTLKKPVAVKVLADQYSSNQSYVDRFYREAKSGALLNHPNIVRCHEVGQDRVSGRYFMVLEYVDGASAMALLDQFDRVSVGDTTRIIYDIARALEHAHSRNVIHRDIKPDNILLTRSGVCKLADLGLAKRTDEVSHLTAARQGFGTPHYMPYEQAINAKYADHRSDIYALGATLYHLVTGKLPFPGENHLDVVELKEQGDFLPARAIHEDLPPELDRILAKMMARDPKDRYQTASELIIDLERSRLMADVPSFADPELAKQDPWFRSTNGAATQPTQPDLNGNAKSEAEPFWVVRFRGPKGKWREAELTTERLERHLRRRSIPVHAEARLSSEETFQVVSEHPALRELLEKIRRAKASRRARRTQSPEESPSPPYWRILLFGMVATVLAVGLSLLLLTLLR